MRLPTEAKLQGGGMSYLRSTFWGVFESGLGPKHVAPCHPEAGIEGILDEPHRLTLDCPCQPEVQGNVIVHNRIQ